MRHHLVLKLLREAVCVERTELDSKELARVECAARPHFREHHGLRLGIGEVWFRSVVDTAESGRWCAVVDSRGHYF